MSTVSHKYLSQTLFHFVFLSRKIGVISKHNATLRASGKSAQSVLLTAVVLMPRASSFIEARISPVDMLKPLLQLVVVLKCYFPLPLGDSTETTGVRHQLKQTLVQSALSH